MRHVHQWRELTLKKNIRRKGGFVSCSVCGEAESLTPRALAEFRRQQNAGIEPTIDNEDIQLIASTPKRSSAPKRK